MKRSTLLIAFALGFPLVLRINGCAAPQTVVRTVYVPVETPARSGIIRAPAQPSREPYADESNHEPKSNVDAFQMLFLATVDNLHRTPAELEAWCDDARFDCSDGYCGCFADGFAYASYYGGSQMPTHAMLSIEHALTEAAVAAVTGLYGPPGTTQNNFLGWALRGGDAVSVQSTDTGFSFLVSHRVGAR